MRRILLALALLCALLAGGRAWAISDPSEALANPAQEARAVAIGEQLRCLVCQNESIEDSGADLARDLRKIVRQQVVAGKTNAQVIAWLVARYGNFVRLSPPLDAATVLLWFSPLIALLAGFGAVLLSRRRTRGRAAAAGRRGTGAAGPPARRVTIAALILLAAVAMTPLAFSLRRPHPGRGRREAALALHRAQLAELERDRAEGRIGDAEHATALIEVQRRLLAADALPDAADPTRSRRLPLLAALVVVPLLAGGLYLVHGRPGLPGAPLAARIQAAHQTTVLVAMLKQRLAAPGLDPERARQGYILLGNTEDSMGDLAAAAGAWRQAVRLRFDPGLAALAAEAQTRVDGGHVGADAAALFARALAEGPKDAPWRPIAEQRVQQASAAK